MALLAFFWVQAMPAHAQGGTVGVSYEVVTLPDPLEVGQEITYKIKWSCSGSIATCGAFSMDYALPDGLEFVSVAVPANYAGTEDNNVINISTEPGAELSDGDSVEATVVLRVGYYETSTDPFPIQGDVTVTTDSGADVNESDLLDPVTLNEPDSKWKVSKARNLPNIGVSPAPGNPVGYEVKFCSNSPTGNVDLTGAVLVDEFPAGATVIDDGGGTVSGNTITWTVGDLNYYPPNNCFVRNIVLEYPEPTFKNNDEVVNNLEGTAIIDGEVVFIDDAEAEDELAGPLLNVALGKTTGSQLVGPDALAEFKFSIDNSGSNVNADNFIMVETIPEDLELVTIHTGLWRDSPQVSANIEYQERDSTTWTSLGVVTATADTTFKGGVLGDDFGSNVGKVRWVFTMPTGAGIPSGFETSVNTAPRIWARSTIEPIDPIDPTNPIAPTINNVLKNCIEGGYVDPAEGQKELENCVFARLTNAPTAITDIVKTSVIADDIGPGEPILFRLNLDLLEESSADWVNPIVTDTLPAGLTFVSWDNVASDFNDGIPANRLPAFTTSTLPGGETLLVWSWTGANAWTVPASLLDRVHKRHVIEYTATPAAGTVPGDYTNVARYSSDSVYEDCNNDSACEDDNTISVRGVGLLESKKWVSGDPSLNYVNSITNPQNLYILNSPVDPTCPSDGTGMTHYPCVARSYPGETLLYRLEVTNGGNIPLRDYILYDVMPHIGDVGVSEALSTDPRGSDWSPLLTGPVIPDDLPAGITADDLLVEYSDLADSCRREVSATSDENGWQPGCVDDWTATPDNWEDVKSIRIAFVDDNVNWPTLTSMVFNMTVRIPETGVPGGSAAWNSIAHRATNETDGSRLLTADPKKAGVIIPYYDWGDLPDLDTDSSASPAYDTDISTMPAPGHVVIPQLYLGAGADAEDGGQPTGAANGDDNNTGDYSVGTVAASGDDEDGIKFLTSIMPSQTVEIEVSAFIEGAPGVQATLGAWIDFNGDGNFSADEFVAHTLTNPGGTGATIISTIQLTAPDAVAEVIYSRFRLAFDSDEVGQLDDFSGSARSGEVEDFVLASLGNRVWMDDGLGGGTPDNGILDGGEQGIEGVTVELYQPGDTPGVDAPFATTTTDPTGQYLFTGLTPDEYFVHLPAENFAPGQPLENSVSSSDTPTSGNVDPDSNPNDESGPTGDENGINGPDPATNGISSLPVTLDNGTEPDVAVDGNGPNSNLTVDFAIVSHDLSMIKTRSAGQSYAADFSTSPPTANFDITLKNQGSATAYNATILDTIPTGMSFQSLVGVIQGTATVSDTGDVAGGRAFVVETLGANESVTFQIVLQIDDLNVGSYTNVAEVTDIQDSTGNSVPDEDSTSDTNPNNDPVNTTPGIDPNGINDQNSHNDIDFDGPGDEDDHDQEVILGGMALGNRVWDDINNNGSIDSGESGIANVLIEVYAADASGNPVGAAVASDSTDANGYWLVDNLPPGNYLAIIPASNFAPSGALENKISSSDVATTGDPNNDQESDDNGIGSPRGTTATGPISSSVITLAPTGEPLQAGSEGDPGPGHGNSGDFFDNLTVDFGFFQYDMADDPDSYGTTLASDGPRHILDGTTFLGSSVDADSDGVPGPNADGDDTLTGGDPTDDEDGVTFLTPIMAGETFTIAIQANANGFLNSWIDFDGNGTFDAGEQITTDQPLSVGTNILAFTAPAAVDEDNLYSRFRFTATSGEATTPNGEAASGEVEDYILMSLGNTVWADNGPDDDSNNGIQDTTEPGIPGVIVEIYPDDATPGVDEPLATTTTDENGDYLFTGLAPDDYVVYLPEENFAPDAPLDDHFSSSDPDDTPVDPDNNQPTDDNGVGDGYDDPSTEGIATLPVTLTPGTEPTDDGDGSQSNNTVSFGLVQYDKGDLPDTAVGPAPGDYETLTSAGHDGAMHAVVSDVYLGAGVDVDADGQPNVDATGDDDNGDDEDGVTFTSRILPGQNSILSVVANMDGYLNTWMDFNGDGDFDDPGEQIAADAALTAGTNNLSFAVPDITLASSLYSRFRFTADDPAGQLGPNGLWDNGEVEDYAIHTQSLGNQIWHDLNNDGLKSDDEPGLDGVVVNLLDPVSGDVILTETTADGGYYLFNGLEAGDYRVEIATSNFVAGGPLEGMNSSTPTESDPNADVDGNDNGVDAPLGNPIQSGLVTLTDDGEPTDETALGPEGHGAAPNDSSNLTVDFGFYLPVSVGDEIWFDNDRDGIQDAPADEPGVPDVTVTLHDTNTNQPVTDPNGDPLTDVTDENGDYLFEDLPPGDYYVVFDPDTLPDNYEPTTPNATNNEDPTTSDQVDSDVTVDPVTQLPQTPPTGMLDSGEDNLDLDLGLVELNNVSVGDKVWFDNNRDGIQGAPTDEPGVPSVTVALYDGNTNQPMLDGNGNPMTDVTDGNGNYLFEELPPGNYYVVFNLNTLPQNYGVTELNAGGDDSADSDGSPTTGATALTGMLQSGEQDLTLDLGISQLNNIRVGDKAWFDNNKDGIQGPPEDEPGLPEMGVALYDANTGLPVTDEDGNPLTDVTDENGNYLFENLLPGNYYVVFDLDTLPQNYVVTKPSATGDDNADSDADPTTGSTGPTGLLQSGEEDRSLDLGVIRLDTVQVGDRVWYDRDKDGVQGAPENEPGVSNVIVGLYNSATGEPATGEDGNPLTDVTGITGNYLFEDLPPGDYYVVFDLDSLPPNYIVTDKDMGGDDGTDSDVDPTTGATGSTGMLNSNQQDFTLDLGIQQVDNVVIGDHVWLDTDQDGIQGLPADEPGVPDVTVTLYDSSTDTPVTDDSGDPLTDVTDENGDYTFVDLSPGDYYVVFDLDTLPPNHVPTEPNQGDDDGADSDADPTTGATSPTGMLDSDEGNLTLDLGIQVLANISVGNKVWFDNDQDGTQGTPEDEPGVPDVTVALYDAVTGEPILGEDGNPLTDVTDENGDYLFEDLQPGNYYVVFDLSTLPENYVATEPSASGDVQTDSDGDPTTGATGATGMLDSGEEDLSLDLGIVRLDTVRVGDRVWFDNDKDGLQGTLEDEPGVPDVTVTLYDNGTNTPVTDADGNPLTDVTSSTGNYLFNRLLPGDYYVVFALDTLPPSYTPTEQNQGGDDGVDSDADPTTGATSPTGMLNSNEQDLTLDLGILQLDNIRVGDKVWFDNNKDGIQGSPESEPGVPDMTVTLYDANTGEPVTDEDGNPLTDVTDENGEYLFDNLPPGNYYLVFDLDTLPQNYVVTKPSATSDNSADSDADPTTGSTGPTGLLTSGQENLTLDLGIMRLDSVRVGDRVWYDMDKNGVQGPMEDEPGVPNVVVMLYDNATGAPVISEDGNPVTDATNATGNYLFEDLPPGDYYVVFDLNTLPPNYIVTDQNAGGDDGTDSDADPTTGATGPTGMLNSNQQDMTLDLGIQRVDNVVVGDQVWLDSDKDGIQDDPEDEPGVPGIVVTIQDTVTGEPITDEEGDPLTDTTDENGEYVFEELPPGDYTVSFDLDTLPPNHVVTEQDATNDESPETSDELDSDVEPTTGLSAPTGELNSDESNLTIDLGIQLLENVRIGDRVWYDLNKDGLQGTLEEEPGVPGMTVTLYDNSTGVPVTDDQGNPLVVVTDEDGNYLFDSLNPGDYYVVFDLSTLPSNYTVTEQNAGGDDGIDSDVDPTTGATGPTGMLNSSQQDMTLDMGIQPLDNVVVGNQVWFDSDKDGIQDDPQDEPGVPGIVVTIQDTATGEPITDEEGNPLTDTTDENGEYVFEGLPPGDYTVAFDLDTLPQNYVVTEQDATSDESPETSDELDSDVEPTTGLSSPTGELNSGESNQTIDLGIQLLENVRIGDRVWNDVNEDGLQGTPEEEPGVPGVTVTLYDNSTNEPVTDDEGNQLIVVTDEDGNYLFDNLPPGDYYIGFDLNSLPDNYVATTQNVTDPDGGALPNTDSDASPITGMTNPTGQLNSGEEKLTLDMGIVQLPTVTVGNYVWLDENGDGRQNTDEVGVPGITVQIYDSATDEIVLDDEGTPMTQITDEDGKYSFTGLSSGQYYVDFDLDTLPDGYAVSPPDQINSDTLDSDADPETGKTTPTELLLSGDRDLSLDMGVYLPVQVGDAVWFDDGNGQQDEGEEGVPGIGVTLYRIEGNTTEAVGTTTTDDNGNYLFDDLPPGNYTVQFDLTTLPDGYIATPPNVGSDDTDSDADPITGQTPPTGLLTSGTTNLNMDMGITQPVQIGDKVWLDNDMDGMQDEGEPGVENVTVTLHDSTGMTVTTTTTDDQGNYLFDNVIPGIYHVSFDLDTLPDDYVVTRPNTTDDQSDSDANPESGRTPNTEYLLGGTIEDSLDMGVHPLEEDTVRIGDLVWEDTNLDGEPDPGENGVPGITLELYDASDPTTPISTTVTDVDGNYLFEGLPPGEYLVTVAPETLPEGTLPPVYYGEDPPNNESSSSGPLNPGEEALDMDIAVNGTGGLDGVAWLDINLDGIRTPDEIAFEGMTVQLLDENGELVDETETDPNGAYVFDDLTPGEYQVQFVSEGITYTISPQNQGDDPTIDSDPNITGTTDIIFVGSGERVPNIDVGLYNPPQEVIAPINLATATIGNLVWADTDEDGIKDDDENGIPGVIVSLLNMDGEVVATVTTDDDGRFEFKVEPGSYQLSFPTLEEMAFTSQDQGDDDTRDSDVNPETGLTGVITVEDDEVDLSYSAGLIVLPTTVRLTSLNAVEVRLGSSPGSAFGTRIRWSTSTEIGTFGFEIYRSHDSDFKNALPIADSIILSRGDDSEYEYIDTTPLFDHAYGYWLVEIQNDDKRYPRGPMRVEITGEGEVVLGALQGIDNMIYLPIVQR